MSNLTKYLHSVDLKWQGRHPKAGANGIAANGGRAWVRRAGGHLLYRGDDINTIDWDIPVGAVSPTSATPGTIKNYVGFPFSADSNYAFGLRAVGCGGIEDDNVFNVVRFRTDGSGVPIPRVPNPPIGVTAVQRPNGFILIRWTYNSFNQEVPPAGWRVYYSSSDDAIEYSSPLSAPGTSFLFDAIGYGFVSGDRLNFGVRSVSGNGDEESNTNSTSIILDLTPPDELPAPTLEEGEDLDG
jgi:hypothetical protein